MKSRILGRGGSDAVIVTPQGQLVTAAYAYDNVAHKALDVINTGYNFFGPIPGKQFVITGMVLKADKQVSSTVDATVIVYEATDDTTTTVDKVLFQLAMVEGDLITLLPLNLLVTAGKYINAKTDDEDIHINIMGYYIPIA